MAGQAVVVPVPSRPNQAHQRTDRLLWAYTVPSLLPSPCDVTQGRCHVALHSRPSSSFCQRRRSAAVTGSSETAYVGDWTKILYFMTRV